MGMTLDEVFGAAKELGGQYIRTRYSRKPDPAAGGNAVPIPAETTVQVRPTSTSAGVKKYAPWIVAALALSLIVGLALKKAG